MHMLALPLDPSGRSRLVYFPHGDNVITPPLLFLGEGRNVMVLLLVG